MFEPSFNVHFDAGSLASVTSAPISTVIVGGLVPTNVNPFVFISNVTFVSLAHLAYIVIVVPVANSLTTF